MRAIDVALEHVENAISSPIMCNKNSSVFGMIDIVKQLNDIMFEQSGRKIPSPNCILARIAQTNQQPLIE